MSLLHEWLKARTIRAEAEARASDLRAWKNAVLDIEERAHKHATETIQHFDRTERSTDIDIYRSNFAALLSALLAARPVTLSEADAIDAAEQAIEELGRLKP